MNNADIHPCLEAVKYNQSLLGELQFALEMSQGQFSLILAKCNYGILRDCLNHKIEEIFPHIPKLKLSPNVTKLYSEIRSIQGDQQLPGLIVYGLESVDNLEQLLLSLNPVREEFRKNCHFAIVLWVNDDIVRLFKRLIPDFESWTNRIVFSIPSELLVNQLKLNSQYLFHKILELGSSSQFVPNNQIFTANKTLEIKATLRDLENEGEELDLELQASIEFAQGRKLNRIEEINIALNHYQKSLNLWQKYINELKYLLYLLQRKETNSVKDIEIEKLTKEIEDTTLREAVTIFYLGICYTKKAEFFYINTEDYSQKAKQYFQQCLDIFEKQQRLDLVAKFCFPLQKNLEISQAWTELEQLTKKVKKLHQTHQMSKELVQDYTFLAEVELNRNNAIEAKNLIKKAFNFLDQKITKNDQGWYYFILSKIQRQLKELKKAVDSLNQAQKINPYHNPQLYLDILQELQDLYYEKNEYLKAFEIKEKQRYIKTQLGINAFIGAGRLQSSNRIKYKKRNSDKQEQVPQEILASGRQYDIEEITKRIGDTQHKLIIIHGQSGVGKSSLINAGLVPFLQHQLIGTFDILPIVLRVYTDWLKELGNIYQQVLSEKEISISIPLDSQENILNQLQKNTECNLLTVLIFDQFEEFFFVDNNSSKIKDFFNFLSRLLNLENIKVILSLREDYLHNLLICNRLESMSIISNDILTKNILYYLGNFAPDNAKEVITRLCENSQFKLEPDLIDYMVEELARDSGEVRPIEMQIMGSQMQTENITTLAKYQAFGTKEKLVQTYLENVIKDCGRENQELAEYVLYLLTDENNTRPLKTREEIEKELKTLILDLIFTEKQLELVLAIFVKSGLVFLIPEQPANRYQIVHDYLVAFIRQQKGENLAKQLKEEREKLEKSEKRFYQFLKIASVGMSILTILAIFFGIKAQIGQTNAELKEMSAKAETIYASGKQLDALIESIKAGKKLQHKFWKFGVENDTRNQVIARLQETVYGLTASNQLEGHTKQITDAVFSPNDQLIASASEDKTIKLWQSDGNLIITLEAHKSEVQTISFSPDSKQIISGDKDGKIILWQIDGENSKKLDINFDGHNEQINDLSFSPDGKLIASASNDGTIKLWNLEGKLFKTLKGHKSDVTQIVFSHDSQLIGSVSNDETIKLWNLEGEELQSFNHDRVNNIMFSADNKMLIMIFLYNWQREKNKEGSLEFWSLNGKLIKTADNQIFGNDLHSATITPDSKKTFVNKKLFELKRTTLELITKDIKFSANQNSKFILNQTSNKAIKLNKKSNMMILYFLPNYYSITNSKKDNIIEINQENLLISVQENLVKFWNFDKQLVQSPIQVSDNITQFNLSKDEKMIASVSSDTNVKLFKQNGDSIKEFNEDLSLLNFSPDGKFILSKDWDNITTLWKTDGTEPTKLEGHQDIITNIYISPNSEIIATVSRDKTAKLWTSQGSLIKTIQEHTERIKDIIFSPNSKLIVTVGEDNQVKLWDKEGNLIQQFKGYKDDGHNILSEHIKFSPDSQMLFVPNDENNNVEIWLRKNNTFLSLEENRVFFSLDSQLIFTISNDKNLKIWNNQDTLIKEIEDTEIDYNYRWWYLTNTQVIFSPNNHFFIYYIPYQSLKIFDFKGELIKDLENICSNYYCQIKISQDSQSIVIVKDNNVEFWDRNGEKIETETVRAYGDNPPSIAVNNSSNNNSYIFNRIASVDKDNIIQLWDSKGQKIVSLTGHQTEITKLKFSADGKTLISIDKDNVVKLWQSSDGKLIKSFDKQINEVTNVRINPHDQSIAIFSDEKMVKVWDNQGNLITKIKGHSNSINSFSFSSDSKMLVSASYDEDKKENKIILSRLPDGKIIRQFQGHSEKINDIIFNPNNQSIVTASNDNNVKLWNLNNLEKPIILKGHSGGVKKVIFSPNGNIIATASADSTVKLWDLNNLEKPITLKGHSSGVTNINFSPDGQMLISHDSNHIYIWSLEGTLLKSFNPQIATISDVKFMSDQNHLIIMGNDYNYGEESENQILIWSLKLDELLKKGCEQVIDYLKTNPNVKDEDRALCNDIINQD